MTDAESQQKVLLVDDSPVNVQILNQLLHGRGYHLLVAKNGEDALRIALQERPDLVLLDVIMPRMDGFEVCRRLKADPETRGAAVIFTSALSETENKVKGLEVGAVDYITKPFDAAEVVARVQTHLTIQRLQRSLAEKNTALERANEFIRSVFGRYVSTEVAQSVLESPEGLDLGGEEREITILMSDLRGFTATVAGLNPKQVLEGLNLYLEAMVAVIGRYRGTIIEILGDSFLVMYGAPVATTDHADRAVACAVAMQRTMLEVNERLEPQGWPHLEMGIGVHTGKCVVGNIGSEQRAKYAAVGPTVNLAGRIESFTVGGQVLVSDATRARMKTDLTLAGEVTVKPKGAQSAMRLGVVAAIGAPFNLMLPMPESRLQALTHPIAVKYCVLRDKAVGTTAVPASLVALAEREARLTSSIMPAELENLSLHFFDDAGAPAGEAYAKVVQDGNGTSDTVRVWFTSIGRETRAWLHGRLT